MDQQTLAVIARGLGPKKTKHRKKWDAGASRLRSHAGAWERSRWRPYTAGQVILPRRAGATNAGCVFLRLRLFSRIARLGGSFPRSGVETCPGRSSVLEIRPVRINRLWRLLPVGLGLRRGSIARNGTRERPYSVPTLERGNDHAGDVCGGDRRFPTRTGGTNGGCGSFYELPASEDRSHAPAWERAPDAPASLRYDPSGSTDFGGCCPWA
jgi:hypothetical protein